MSGGMTLRLAGAVLAALLGLLWWKVSESRRPSSDTDFAARANRTALLLRNTVLLLSAFWAAAWLAIALLRLRYPYELEWIGGAMRDHCERVLTGKPLYVPPGPDWFPYEYPPLYFWTSAMLMRCTGGLSFAAMRLVSILSTLGCVWLLFLWVRECLQRQFPEKQKDGGEIRWGLIAGGVFLATYRFTGAWYDAERLDMLFLVLSLLGVYGLQKAVFAGDAKAAPFAALSAIAFGLAFLTKQQAILFVFGGLMALTWSRQFRLLAVFGLSSLLCMAVPGLALNRATGGWFGYYCFKVPLANGIQMHLARQYVLGDLPLYAPILALLLIGVFSGRMRRGAELSKAEEQTFTPLQNQAVLVCMTLMGVLGSLLSRAHWGGDQNVLIAGFLFLCAAGGVAAGTLERQAPGRSAPLYALVLAQFLILFYRPDLQLPKAVHIAAGQAYADHIHQLEREGEVLCLDHGGQTSPRHFQIMGLLDVIGTEKGLPPSLTSALRAHRYAAIVMDARPQAEGVWTEFLRDYAPAECWNITQAWVVTGYPTPNAERRVWVLRPR